MMIMVVSIGFSVSLLSFFVSAFSAAGSSRFSKGGFQRLVRLYSSDPLPSRFGSFS